MRLRDQIEIVTRTQGTVADRYGDLPDIESAAVTVPAYVEPLDATEDEINRDTRRSRYLVLVRADATVDALARITWEGEDYEVIGEPGLWKNHRGAHHRELEMRRIEG
jgi:hypothetical protein